MERAELERLDRDTLITQAEAVGVVRAAVLTRPELIDELLVRNSRRKDDPALRRARGLFGRARDLLARVIERGLHLPDAADRVRPTRASSPPPPRMPTAAVPTVTLAEIYATQGHKEKALETLRRVIELEPDHAVAKSLAAELEGAELPKPALPPEGDDDAADEDADDSDADVDGPGSSLGANGTSGASGSGEGPKPKKKKKAKGKLKTTKDAVLETADKATVDPAAVAVAPAVAAAADAKPAKPAEPAEAPEPMGMLDDSPLPPKYDVDECVVIPVDPTTMFVYWELKDETRAHLERTRPGGAIFLRVLVIEASWDGPRTFTRDHEVYVSLGDWFIRELPSGCIVRAAIGWRTDDGAFVPVAHSPALEAHPSRPSAMMADALVRWTPTGAMPIQKDDQDATAIHRALGRVEVAATRRGSTGGIPRLTSDGVVSLSVTPLGSSERMGPGGPGGRLGGASDLSLGR
ncbi:MAG: hypothetical protein JWM74_4368 [Myxococcaceae bacterium]|nr:hypothetical protein [Myxococcaceae bacterium]